jgi:hypothetical protein
MKDPRASDPEELAGAGQAFVAPVCRLSTLELAEALRWRGFHGTLLARAEDAFVRAYRASRGEMGGEDGV